MEVPGASMTLTEWGHDPLILGNDPILRVMETPGKATDRSAGICPGRREGAAAAEDLGHVPELQLSAGAWRRSALDPLQLGSKTQLLSGVASSFFCPCVCVCVFLSLFPKTTHHS